MSVKKDSHLPRDKKRILINIEPKEFRAAVVIEGKLDEFFVERPDDYTVVGNIYKGKIDSVAPSVGAYFVDIGLEKRGFLYIKDVKTPFLDEEVEELKESDSHAECVINLKKGDDVLVQVVKEPFSTKGARLTTNLSIPGRYTVLTPNKSGIGISRKIEDQQERNRLRQIIKELTLPKDVGFIIRTAALEKQNKDLVRDVNFLNAVWHRIDTLSKRRKTPSLIYEEYDLPLRIIRDVYVEDIDKIIVDSKHYYRNILRFVKTYMPHLSKKVYFAKEDIPLFEREGIESQIQNLYEPRVRFKSGAYLVIEPTEGLVAIDVNSGSFKTNKNQEETAFMVNMEAAFEIARQLRLRDIGGLIVIDFIDMSRESNRRKLINSFKDSLSRDRVRTDILGLSRFGLLEMARQRTRRTLESIYYQNCPYCKGRGKIKSVATAATHVLRELRQLLSAHPRANVITVRLHPEIKDALVNFYSRSLYSMQRHFHKRIELIPDRSLHIEDMLIA